MADDGHEAWRMLRRHRARAEADYGDGEPRPVRVAGRSYNDVDREWSEAAATGQLHSMDEMKLWVYEELEADREKCERSGRPLGATFGVSPSNDGAPVKHRVWEGDLTQARTLVEGRVVTDEDGSEHLETKMIGEDWERKANLTPDKKSVASENQ